MNDHLLAFLKQNPHITEIYVDQGFNYLTAPCTGYEKISVAELLGDPEKKERKPRKNKQDGTE